MGKFLRTVCACSKLIVIISIPIAFCDQVGHPGLVIGRSMEPTLYGRSNKWWENDIVWLSKLSLKPKVGDIYAFVSPRGQRSVQIKRVSGIPGKLAHASSSQSLVIQDNQYWMLSDNKNGLNMNNNRNMDSLAYGPVNAGLIVAKATRIMWPPNRMTTL